MFLEKYTKARLQKQAAAADVLNSIKTWMRSSAGRDMLKRLAIGGGTALAVQGATGLVDPEGKHRGKRAAASILMGLLAGYKGPEAYEWGKLAFNKGPREAWRLFHINGMEGGTPQEAIATDQRRAAADKAIADREQSIKEGEARIQRLNKIPEQVRNFKAMQEAVANARQDKKNYARDAVLKGTDYLLRPAGVSGKAAREFREKISDIAERSGAEGRALPAEIAHLPFAREQYERGKERGAFFKDQPSFGEEPNAL